MEIPYTVTARPDTGLWNAKVGIWLFLASEVMLFGGLFSSYLFLRLGADYPWPHGELTVGWGFLNTFVLIASSVFVVYAWVSLKMRKYGAYKFWMFWVVFCAGWFLVNKGIEYSKKFTHFNVQLKDGSIVAGHIEKKENRSLGFEATSVTVNYAKGGMDFLKFANDLSGVSYKTASGKDVLLSKAWFAELRSAQKMQAQADALIAGGKAEAGNELAAKVSKKYPQFADFKSDANVKLTLSKPVAFLVPRKFASNWLPNELNLTDKFGSPKLEGKLTRDKLRIYIDEVDLRRYLRPEGVATTLKPADASVFKYMQEHDRTKLLESYNKHRDEKLAELDAKHTAWRAKHPGKEPHEDRYHEFERLKLEKAHAGDSHAASGEHHGPELVIPWDDVKFFSTWGPHKNTFYAIYFTMTGLHGLHVLIGALVLLYFLVFGKSLYLKNPEHLANRVEVGGLFWHFVDLVWIFLFPIFYLM